MRKPKQLLSAGFIGLLILAFAMASWGCGEKTTEFTANVMAPLHVMNYNAPDRFEVPADWQSFETELRIAKTIGVRAVSVDVWWGDVETQGDNRFNWSYYREVFQRIINAGLKIVPIISLHQCGGNVGDTYTSLLPAWVWEAIKGKNSVNDLKYQSELGNYSNEYVSLWADSCVMPQYREFMIAFVEFCSQNQFIRHIEELNISCGPAGELRYPSYNAHDWIFEVADGNKLWEKKDQQGNVILRGDRTNWPHRGALQCYGKLALADFRAKMKLKYGSLKRLQAAWGVAGQGLNSFTEIRLPNQGNDHGYPGGQIFKADQLFQNGAYYKSQYGRDLIEWYNQSLIDHGKRLLDLADQVFAGAGWRKIPLGIKIPGIHWQMGTLGGAQPEAPRAAEIAAGLIRLGPDFARHFDLNEAAAVNGHGYREIIRLCNRTGRPVNLHFTCLEMGNSETGGSGETPKQYSLAKTLVGWVALEAYRQGVTIKGENALSGGLPWTNEDFPGDWVDAWDHINQALERYPYAGITMLRMTDVTTVKNPDNGKTVGQDRYRELIAKFKRPPVDIENLTVFYRSSQLNPPKLNRLLIWSEGKRMEYPMTDMGVREKGRWWQTTVPVPQYCKFAFSEEPGLIRVYSRYPDNDTQRGPLDTVYILSDDLGVYRQKPVEF